MELDENGNPIVTPTAATPEEIKKQVDALVAEELKNIKAKLDAAYSQRDEIIRKNTALEEEQKQIKMKALEAEGKHSEVADMKVAALEEKLRIAERRNVEYSRDFAVRDALVGLSFRNERSQAMAYRDVLEQLVQDEGTGQWNHKTGVSIKEFVAAFSKDEENSFLFTPKVNSGSGGGNTPAGGLPDMTKGKKLSELSSAEILNLAKAGKFGSLDT